MGAQSGLARLQAALAILWSFAAPCFGRLVVITGRNDTYLFEDAQAVFGGGIPALGITAQLVVGEPSTGCSALRNDVTGRLVLVDRGSCDFVTKARNVQFAGALAVLVADNTDGPLVIMNSRGQRADDILIPAAFIAKADGNLIKDVVGGQLASVGKPVIGTLYPSMFVQSWPTFVLPFVVIFVLSVFLLTFYFIYRRRRRYYRHVDETLSKADLEKLPRKRHGSLAEGGADIGPVFSDSCAICLEDFGAEDDVRVLPCHHEFHVDCVDKWLTTRKGLCPVCKRDIRVTETTPLLQGVKTSSGPDPSAPSTSAAAAIPGRSRPHRPANSRRATPGDDTSPRPEVWDDTNESNEVYDPEWSQDDEIDPAEPDGAQRQRQRRSRHGRGEDEADELGRRRLDRRWFRVPASAATLLSAHMRMTL